MASAAIVGVVLVLLGLRGSGDAKDSIAKDAPDGTAQSAQATQDAQAAREEDPGLARRMVDDPMALGDVDAPVVIVEYADFRCPFCARFARETLPDLTEKYIDTGLVRYEFRDLPMFGQESWDAAVAGRAAARQGRFWEFLEVVYADAPERGHPPMPKKVLLDFAQKAGVPDLEQFEADLDRTQLHRDIEADATQAQRLGLTAVPFFVIDNMAVSGAQPISVFEQVIEERLDAHGVVGRD